MLDELLGRAELKDRIEELEEEKRHLQRQLDAEEERRADAVSERQQAEKRVNRLEDRIADLEGTVERLEEAESAIAYRRTETAFGHRVETILDRLESLETGPEGVLTAYVADGNDLPEAVRDAFDDRSQLVARSAPCLAVLDDAALVSAALSVPNPPASFATWSDSVEFEREWFLPTDQFTFGLVRSDLFAIGDYDGTEQRSAAGFEGDVKGAHSKGGFSQARFQRRRDEQIAAHVKNCREELEERDPERLYLAGEKSVLGEFESMADATAAVDATGDPEDAIEDAFADFWTVTVRSI
jgi:peptide subunit release factor 1 (eRF1)